MPFTQAELEEIRAADEEIEREFRMSRQEREQYRKAHYAAHREEIAQYRKAYYAAHRGKNAKNRKAEEA